MTYFRSDHFNEGGSVRSTPLEWARTNHASSYHSCAQTAPAKRRIRPLLAAAWGSKFSWAGFLLEGFSRLASRLPEQFLSRADCHSVRPTRLLGRYAPSRLRLSYRRRSRHSAVCASIITTGCATARTRASSLI